MGRRLSIPRDNPLRFNLHRPLAAVFFLLLCASGLHYVLEEQRHKGVGDTMDAKLEGLYRRWAPLTRDKLYTLWRGPMDVPPAGRVDDIDFLHLRFFLLTPEKPFGDMKELERVALGLTPLPGWENSPRTIADWRLFDGQWYRVMTGPFSGAPTAQLLLAYPVPWMRPAITRWGYSLFWLLGLGTVLVFLVYLRDSFTEPLKLFKTSLKDPTAFENFLKEFQLSMSPELGALLGEIIARERGHDSRYKGLNEKFELLSTISDITMDLRGEIDIDRSCKILLQGLISRAGYDRILLAFRDEESPFLQGKMAFRNFPSQIFEMKIPLDDEISPAATVFRSGKPYSYFKPSDAGEGVRSDEIMVPLILKDRTVGIIGVDNSITLKPITEFEKTILTTLATQIGFTLENSLLIRKIQSQVRESEDKNRQLNRAMEAVEKINNTLKTQNRIHEEELDFAFHTQQALLPSHFPRESGFQVSLLCRSARELGGDFYNFVPLDEQTVAIIIGDVSGKGVGASLIMAIASNSLFNSFVGRLTPEQALASLNETFLHFLQATNNMYVTVFCGLIHRERGEITYCKAGQSTPFLQKKATGELIPLDAGGVFIGMFEELFLETKTHSFGEGDRLILFTDGAVDNRNPQGELYSEARLRSFLEQSNTASPSEVVRSFDQEINQFVAGQPLFDDTTFIIIDPVPLVSRVITRESTLQSIADLQAQFLDWGGGLGIPQKILETGAKVARELLYNALYHGNQKDPEKKIHLHLEYPGAIVKIGVRDEGSGMVRGKQLKGAEKSELSGLSLVRRLADSFHFDEATTTAWAQLKIPIKLSSGR